MMLYRKRGGEYLEGVWDEEEYQILIKSVFKAYFWIQRKSKEYFPSA